NTLFISTDASIAGGTLDLGTNQTVSVQGKLRVAGGALDFGQGGSQVGTQGVAFSNGGTLRWAGTGTSDVAFNPVGPDAYSFSIADATVDIRGSMPLSIEHSQGVTVSSAANILNFNRVAFDDFQATNTGTALTLARSSAAAYAFSGLLFNGNYAHDVDASGVPAGSTVAIVNSGGQYRGSPYAVDPSGVLRWLPDGGGAASISGFVMYPIMPAQPNFILEISTDPTVGPGGLSSVVYASSMTLFGSSASYAASGLNAPATYYLFATHGPDTFGYDFWRGGYNHPGFLRSDPVFVGTGTTLSNVNFTAGYWSTGTVTLTNNSSQAGSLRVAAYSLQPDDVSTNALEAVSPPVSAGSVELNVPTTWVMLIGWVDVNGNGRPDPFEASGTYGPVQLPNPNVTPGYGPFAINITGGSAAAGGTVSVATSSLNAGIIGDSGEQGLMRLALGNTGAQSTLNGLALDLSGGPVALNQGYNLEVYLDANANGTLETAGMSASGPNDYVIGSTFTAPGAASAVINFYQPLQLQTGATIFIVASNQLQSGHPELPPLSVRISTSNRFLLSAGQMAAQPLYPIVNNSLIGYTAYAQTQPDAFGGGGYATGVMPAPGQTVTVTPDPLGRWSFSGQSTNASGLAGTQTQPTISQGNRVGALLVSAGGGWVAVGTGTTVTMGDNAQLGVHLAANDNSNNYFQDQGGMTALIHVSGSTTSAVQGTVAYLGSGVGSITVQTVDCQNGGIALQCQNVVASTQVLVNGAGGYAYLMPLPRSGHFSGVKGFFGSGSFGGSAYGFDAPAASTATVDFTVYAGTSSIGGALAYSGQLTVGDFQIGVTTSNDFQHDVSFVGGSSQAAVGPYLVTNLPSPATFYIISYRTAVGDHPQGADPIGPYAVVPSSQVEQNLFSSQLLPVYLTAGSSATINLTLADRGAISGGLYFGGPVNNAQVIVQAAHGLFGAPGYTPESRDFEYVSSAVSGSSASFLISTLRAPATDYSVLAFVDANHNGMFDPGEPFATSASLLSVPAGGFANIDLQLGSGNQKPPQVVTLPAVSSQSYVSWLWNLTPGATGYELLTSTGGVVAAVSSATACGGSGCRYDEAGSPAQVSNIVKVSASNASGPGLPGPFAGVPFAVFAAAPPTPVISSVYVSSAVVTVGLGANLPSAEIEILRSTLQAGPFSEVFASSGAASYSFTDLSLAPATSYYYQAEANDPTFRGAGQYSGVASTFTLPATGNHVSGPVLYAGRQTGDIIVQAFSSSGPLAGLIGSVDLPNSSNQPYFIPFGSTSGFLRAFVDVNGNKAFDAGEDYGLAGPAGPSTNNQFVQVSVDTVPPNSPAGLQPVARFGEDDLTWSAPLKSADGSSINDLAGFRVQRTTSIVDGFATISTQTVLGATGTVAGTSFADMAPVTVNGTPVNNYYRVVAVDFGGNESVPSGAVGILPTAGGTVSGSVSSFTALSGTLRIRLSTSPRREDPYYAESTLSSFTFTGLPDNVYYLRGFIDTNGDRIQQTDSEPAGTDGGIDAPFPLVISGGNTISGEKVRACDRTGITPGVDKTGTLTSADCPALDRGPGFVTRLYTFRVGGGAQGSIGQGAQVQIGLTDGSGDPDVILLGPDGQKVAENNNSGYAQVSFNVNQPGLYIIEPTTFNQFTSGSDYYDLRLDVTGGYGGSLSGAVSYSGAKAVSGASPMHIQLFTGLDANAAPVVDQTYSSTGSFNIGNLRDGTYYVRA
ncbi:MAG: hypothetical protein KGL53_13860, partial [Elusimicrobia bacterium]|nr:hypothetical protein [Elusimicrobiota bacterium]